MQNQTNKFLILFLDFKLLIGSHGVAEERKKKEKKKKKATVKSPVREKNKKNYHFNMSTLSYEYFNIEMLS